MNANTRQYIRHPIDIPIEITVDNHHKKLKATDLGEGGLCFVSAHALTVGDNIHIIIPMCDPAFDAEGIVCWCRADGQTYLIGLTFQDKSIAYTVRMVEQICHIEDYKRQVFTKTGKKISNGQAAKEWIEKYAGTFPSIELGS